MTAFLYNLNLMRIGAVKDWVKAGETEKFGEIKLKPMQLAILRCNKEHDVLVNLPTGFGKSLLFQYPASKLHGQCIVVIVPLKALLWDCLKEAELHGLTASECDLPFIKKYEEGKPLPQLLFLTPERLFQNQAVLSFLDYMHCEKKIYMFVIDQAHCISEWGSDFRVDYARLGELKTIFPGARLLGMSATIPPQALKDLIAKLQIFGCHYFQSSSNRPNLIYEVLHTETKLVPTEIVTYLKNKGLMDEAGIVYCQTIKKAEEVYEQLKRAKLECCLFHSQLSENVRSENFNNFMNEKTKCIVATICFGMGVNKKNIRYVINVGVSQTAENYYQQSGRAGRDGLPSYCLLLTFQSDTNALNFLIHRSTKKQVLLRRKLFKLKQIKDYTKSKDCRKKVLFKLLGQQFSREECKKTCDFCRDDGKQTVYDTFDYSQKGFLIIEELQRSKLKFTKRQMADFLRGKETRHKFMTEKMKKIFQILKKEPSSHAELLIDTLIQRGLLEMQTRRVGNGARQRYVQYLKPCNKSELNNQRKQTIQVKVPTKQIPKRKLDIDAKFNKYLAKKTNSLQKLEFQKEFDEKKEVPNQDEDLKEIKMISIGADYQKFFDELFPENAEMEKIYEGAMNEQQYVRDDEEEQQLASFSVDVVDVDQTQFENPYLQKEIEGNVKTNVIIDVDQAAKTERKNSDSDSDESLMELIKRKKAEISRKSLERKERETVIRKKPHTYQFL